LWLEFRRVLFRSPQNPKTPEYLILIFKFVKFKVRESDH
jgi:hypothetical protein